MAVILEKAENLRQLVVHPIFLEKGMGEQHKSLSSTKSNELIEEIKSNSQLIDYELRLMICYKAACRKSLVLEITNETI